MGNYQEPGALRSNPTHLPTAPSQIPRNSQDRSKSQQNVALSVKSRESQKLLVEIGETYDGFGKHL